MTPRSQCLELSDDRHVRSKLLVDHKTKDAHHGCPSVVQLDGALPHLGGIIKLVPAVDELSIPEVADELIALVVINSLHNSKLKDADEGKDLLDSSLRDGVVAEEGGKAARVRREGVAGVVDVSVEEVSRSGSDLSKEGKHGNSAVLDLDESKAVESGLVGVIEHTERIKESERSLGTKLVLDWSSWFQSK